MNSLAVNYSVGGQFSILPEFTSATGVSQGDFRVNIAGTVPSSPFSRFVSLNCSTGGANLFKGITIDTETSLTSTNPTLVVSNLAFASDIQDLWKITSVNTRHDFQTPANSASSGVQRLAFPSIDGQDSFLDLPVDLYRAVGTSNDNKFLYIVPVGLSWDWPATRWLYIRLVYRQGLGADCDFSVNHFAGIPSNGLAFYSTGTVRTAIDYVRNYFATAPTGVGQITGGLFFITAYF